MSALPYLAYTEAEYLALDADATDQKFCFDDGNVFAMAGATPTHVLISSNVITALGLALRDGPCRVYGSDLRVRIGEGRAYFYPDVSVVCEGESLFDRMTLENPVLIVEVLSDSTEALDRGRKFSRYQRIPSLVAYVLVSQHYAFVELFERMDEGAWRLTSAEGVGSVLRIGALGIDLDLAEVYRKVTFEPPKPIGEPRVFYVL